CRQSGACRRSGRRLHRPGRAAAVVLSCTDRGCRGAGAWRGGAVDTALVPDPRRRWKASNKAAAAAAGPPLSLIRVVVDPAPRASLLFRGQPTFFSPCPPLRI